MPYLRSTSTIMSIITFVLFLSIINGDGKLSFAAARQPAGVRVTINAPQTTISWDERDPDREKFELPLLYLHRQREVAGVTDRTLEIQFAGLDAATEIQIEAVSHHVNVATGIPHTETTDFMPDRACTLDRPCSVHWTLDSETMLSDLYYLRVLDNAGQMLWEDPIRPAFAALDTWDIELDDGRDVAYVVRVYYASLFPFTRGKYDWTNRLSPDAVTDFIDKQFVPIIQDTWRIQVEDWGFGQPLHPDWDADKVVELIITVAPFALFDGTGTYTWFNGDNGRYYSTRRIWWFANNHSFLAYDTLENAYKVTFAHEFFHLMQWNVLLSQGRALSARQPLSEGKALSTRQASTGLIDNSWQSWTEGLATAASAIQYPELVLHRDHLVATHSAYGNLANQFLAQDLNTSYAELDTNPSKWYEGALYWHFLYERYNHTDIFRAALEEMMRHADGDDGDFVVAMNDALDATFARVDGPFHSYKESLIAFASANYALRLTNGRCTVAGATECQGRHYDPEQMYGEPPLEAELEYDGSRLTYSGAISSSFGVDLVEVALDLTVHGRPLAVRFQGEGAIARFNVQLWKLGPGIGKPRAVTPAAELVPQGPGGAHLYNIPAIDWRAYNRIALIITRIDADESIAPVGNYRITLGTQPEHNLEVSPAVEVTLSAQHTTTFWNERDPDRVKFELPLLYLHRQRDATPEADRSLDINVAGLAGGTEIQIEVVSFHTKTWTGRRPSETRTFTAPSRSCTTAEPCTFRWTFDVDVLPSDFYHLRIRDAAGDTLWENPKPGRPDFVALDTWDVELGESSVGVEQATTERERVYRARITYATLFPFAKDPHNFGDNLPPLG